MALHTITGLAGTQASDGTYKINFSFTATDADSDTLYLVPEYKLSTSSTWLPATTNLPATVAATPGGVLVNGVWDLDKDFEDNLQGATFNFRVTATRKFFATGSLTAIAANTTNGIEEGDSFVVGGKTFEFTTDNAVTPGRFPVLIPSATATNAQVKAAIIAAINAPGPDQTTASVTASSGAGMVINLVAKTEGTGGNVAITQSISNSATLTPVGMVGGLASEVVTAPVTLSGIDTGVASTENTAAVPELTPDKNDVEISRLEGTNKQKGAVASGGFRWSRAKSAIEDIRLGKQTIVTIYSDRAIGTGVAVLVNPEVYADLLGSETTLVVNKPVQWLMNTAWRSFSSLFRTPTTVYAIQISSVGDAVGFGNTRTSTGTTVAYLISYVDYLRMNN